MASFVLPIISGLAGLFGGGKQQQQQQTNNTTTSGTQSGSTSSSTSPQLSDLQSLLSHLFGDASINQYRQGTDLSGYEAGAERDINSGSDSASKTIANNLASRGLSFSPYAATALAQPEINRVNQISSLRQSIPLLQRQLQQQDIGNLEGAFKTLPTATSTSGTSNVSTSGQSNQSGTNVTSGDPLAGLFGGLGAGLAGPGAGGNSNLQNIMKSLGLA